MVLADTSAWVDHLRQGNPRLAALLTAGEVLCHPFVIGVASMGSGLAFARLLQGKT
jgi:predicted nucleic acid-binding protein